MSKCDSESPRKVQLRLTRNGRFGRHLGSVPNSRVHGQAERLESFSKHDEEGLARVTRSKIRFQPKSRPKVMGSSETQSGKKR